MRSIRGLIADVLADRDHSTLPLALRTVADVVGVSGMAARTGLSGIPSTARWPQRDTPRFDTLGAILDAFRPRPWRRLPRM